MSYSTYEDMWHGDPYIYGYAEIDDLGGCISGGLSQTTTLYSPSRSAPSSGSQSVLSFSGETGDWTVVGNYTLQCNCGPQGVHAFGMAGGLTFNASTIVANYYYDGPSYLFDWKNYVRCVPGNCNSMHFPIAGTPPFLNLFILRIAGYNFPGAVCTLASTPIPIPSC